MFSDDQLIAPANYIYEVRSKFSIQLFPVIQQFYKKISGNNETINLEYNSQIKENNFSQLLTASRQKDKLLQRTNVGIHKDELNFLLNENPFKLIARKDSARAYYLPANWQSLKFLKR